ncbi:uncharacterized protein LOC143257139 isoform X2 [Tachypleus tridentatus]|uniref:uncharacterized protein LOC143257139 isoform X2 n=1 Tax=Tachypleus tridentatus TaxID=6853 RepID=UPI003FD10627
MIAGQQLVVFSWVIPILLCLVIVVLLVLCTCFGKSKKSVTYGTTGGWTFPSNPSVQHTEGLEANGHMIIPAPDDAVSLDPKARAKDRALPDIPLPVTTRSSTSESNPDSLADNPSDCYATVTKEILNPVKPKNHRRNKPKAPKPPGMNELTVSITSESDGRPHSAPMTPASFENASKEFLRPSSLVQVVNVSESNINCSQVSSVRYSLLQRYTELDNRNTGVNHSQSVSSKGPTQPEFNVREPSTSEEPYGDAIDLEGFLTSQPAGSFLSVEAEGRSRNPSTAGQAVAGQIPSAEIPYMTPPLQHSPLRTNMEGDGEISSGNKDTPYNMISVREPLAKVREETLKLQLRQQPRTSSNQVSGSQSSEGHYMVVPDEEEMYEEIDPGSSQHSERSSSMYASIESERRQLPPAPPTVESLKCVAQAHSRQASYTSATSFEISEMMGTAEDDTNQLMKDLSGLYSVVDKAGKQRQTIHVAEGVSFLSNSKDEPHTVEEMYAKVHKKRHGSSSSASGIEEIGRYSFSSSVDVFAPPVPP